jgi:type II secretory pathway component PulJ
MARTRQWGDDDGITLVELMVSMTVMAVFMAVFTGSMVEIYRSQNKNEASTAAMAQINNAFLKLDKEIRYASAVSTEGTASGSRYIEFLTISPTSGAKSCTELRYSPTSQLLQQRTWAQSSGTPSPSAWALLASNVISIHPFTYLSSDQTHAYQRMKLDLTARWGTNDTATSRQTVVTLTALNTTSSTSSGTVCTEGRSVS